MIVTLARQHLHLVPRTPLVQQVQRFWNSRMWRSISEFQSKSIDRLRQLIFTWNQDRCTFRTLLIVIMPFYYISKAYIDSSDFLNTCTTVRQLGQWYLLTNTTISTMPLDSTNDSDTCSPSLSEDQLGSFPRVYGVVTGRSTVSQGI